MKTKNKKEGNTLENYNNQEANQPVIHSSRKMNSEMEMTQKTVWGLQFDFSNNPISEIEKCTGIIINQEPASFELISGCERNIVYHIIGETSQGNKYLFRCEEKYWLSNEMALSYWVKKIRYEYTACCIT